MKICDDQLTLFLNENIRFLVSITMCVVITLVPFAMVKYLPLIYAYERLHVNFHFPLLFIFHFYISLFLV